MASTNGKASTITFTFPEDVEEGDYFLITKHGVKRGDGWDFNVIVLQKAKAGEPILAVGTTDHVQVPSTVQR